MFKSIIGYGASKVGLGPTITTNDHVDMDHYEIVLDHGTSSFNSKMVTMDSDLYKKLLGLPDDKPIYIMVNKSFELQDRNYVYKICRLIQKRTHPVSIFISKHVGSFSILVALCCHQLFLDKNATMNNLYFDISTVASKQYDLVEEEHYKDTTDYVRDSMKKYINERHNVDEIMRQMYTDILDTTTIFFTEDLKEMGVEFSLFH